MQSRLNPLQVILRERMRADGLSTRDVEKATGGKVSHSTVARLLGGEPARLDTLMAMCEWLKISPAIVLESFRPDDDGLAARVAAIIETVPTLRPLFEDAYRQLEDGTIDLAAFKEFAAYATWRLTLRAEGEQSDAIVYARAGERGGEGSG